MRFTVITAEQRTPDWYAARLGCLCASDAAKMLSKREGRDTLRVQLAADRLTTAIPEDADDAFVSADMQRGIELEPQARIAYEFQTGVSVAQTGFVRHADYMAGCSPDGVIGDFDGLVEIKAPRTPKHISYIRSGGIPSDYKPQLLHQLWITGARFVDFVSFDPTIRLERLQLYVCRLDRDAAAIADYEAKALAFLAEVDREVEALMTLADPAGMLAAAIAEVA